MFDKDGSGKIDSAEIQALLSGEEFGDVYSKAQLEQAIREVDENGDGEIDFEEFVLMMKGIQWAKNKREKWRGDINEISYILKPGLSSAKS